MTLWQRLFRGERKAVPASVRLTDLEALELFGARPNASGLAVSVEAALRCPAVACAVRAISEAVAQLPVKVQGADGQQDDANPVARWATQGPNPWTGWHDFASGLVRDAIIHGRGLALITRGGDGRALEAHRLPRGSCTREQPDALAPPVYRVWLASGGSETYQRGDIIDIAPLDGQSLVTLASEAIGISLALEGHAARLMANGARPGGVIETDTGAPSLSAGAARPGPEAEREAQSRFAERFEGLAGSGRTLHLPPGRKFKPIQWTTADIGFADMRSFQIEEIARTFRVPVTILQSLAKATQSNVENQALEFVRFGLLAWVRMIEGELSRVAGLPVRLDLHELLRADTESRADAYAKLVTSGLTLNEVRELEGRAPKPGGDDLLRPMNMTRATAPDAKDQPANG